MPPRMPYPENQLWALALAAVITELDHAHHDGIGGWGEGPKTRTWCKDRLKEFYGIESPEDLRKSASDFFQQGHTAESREALAALPEDPRGDDVRQALVRENRAEIQHRGVLAWESARVT